MNFEHCFKFLSGRFRDEVIVTSAGNCSELWWEITGETERVFYLEASMSLASLFAAGIALGSPHRTVVAFSGDGAFCMFWCSRRRLDRTLSAITSPPHRHREMSWREASISAVKLRCNGFEPGLAPPTYIHLIRLTISDRYRT